MSQRTPEQIHAEVYGHAKPVETRTLSIGYGVGYRFVDKDGRWTLLEEWTVIYLTRERIVFQDKDGNYHIFLTT